MLRIGIGNAVGEGMDKKSAAKQSPADRKAVREANARQREILLLCRAGRFQEAQALRRQSR